jgi:N-acetylglucosaminyl-diphospho-decaprenol L-rhamnosyltransferase
MDDLAVIVVSTNEAGWLRTCLSSILAHQGDCRLDLVVVDNESTDDTRAVASEFLGVRVVPSRNHGFAHANNRGLMTTNARYVLFLNPDTEIRSGTLEALVRLLDERPEVGLAGVVQLTSDGQIYPTIRRFPNAIRALGDALVAERLPVRARWMGERELNFDVYKSETECDWTSGSFMITRREALESSGLMDERFFIYSEEPDLCLRLKQAGWEIRHLPQLTIVHHAGKAGVRPRMAAQDAFTRMQLARKHFSPVHRLTYKTALGFGYLIRALAPERDESHAGRRAAGRAALRVLLGIDEPPFGTPPRQAVEIRSQTGDS